VKFLSSTMSAILLSLVCVSFSSTAYGQAVAEEPAQAEATKWTADQTALKRISHDIEYMASDEMGGRKPGTPGIKMCEDYIVSEFKKAGVKPLDNGTYFQELEVAGPRRLLKEESALRTQLRRLSRC